jgi:CheY-like chemotaxis protein
VAVLDDDPALVDLYSTILQDEDFAVTLVPYTLTFDEILNRIRKSRAELLILDIRIPGIDSLEVIRALENDPADLPIKILICSASHNEIATIEQKLQTLGLPVPAILEKPFDLDDFLSLVHELTN